MYVCDRAIFSSPLPRSRTEPEAKEQNVNIGWENKT